MYGPMEPSFRGSKCITMRALVLIGLFLFTTVSCDPDRMTPAIVIRPAEPPFLRLSNQLEENYAITSWKMEGYEYTNLHISPGSSEQYLLNSGMRNGYKNIEVNIFLSSNDRSFSMSTKVSFESGGITTITIISEDQIDTKW